MEFNFLVIFAISVNSGIWGISSVFKEKVKLLIGAYENFNHGAHESFRIGDTVLVIANNIPSKSNLIT